MQCEWLLRSIEIYIFKISLVVIALPTKQSMVLDYEKKLTDNHDSWFSFQTAHMSKTQKSNFFIFYWKWDIIKRGNFSTWIFDTNSTIET